MKIMVNVMCHVMLSVRVNRSRHSVSQPGVVTPPQPSLVFSCKTDC